MSSPNIDICEKCEFFNKMNLVNLKDKLTDCEHRGLFVAIYCDKLPQDDYEDGESIKNSQSIIGWYNAVIESIDIDEKTPIPIDCPFELEHILANQK